MSNPGDYYGMATTISDKDKRIAELETALAADLGYTELPDCIKRDPVRDAFLIRQADELKAQRERNSELDMMVANQYNTIAELREAVDKEDTESGWTPFIDTLRELLGKENDDV